MPTLGLDGPGSLALLLGPSGIPKGVKSPNQICLLSLLRVSSSDTAFTVAPI